MYYRFIANKDTFLDNYYSSSNFGKDQLLEVGKPVLNDGTAYPIRSLIQFDTDNVISKINSGDVSGSAIFELKLFECQSNKSLQDDFWIDVLLVSQSWNEGTGSRASAHVNGTTNWYSASDGVDWTTGGGDYRTITSASQQFVTGSGDLSVDVTKMIGYITGSVYSNYGFLIKLRDESGTVNYNQKYFYGRDTHTIYEPILFAKWNDFVSSGSATASTTWKDYKISLREPKEFYSVNEKIRFELFIRDQYPTLTYSTSSLDNLSNTAVPDLIYEIKDINANETWIPYSAYTSCSYSASFNYFNVDMNMFQSNRFYELNVKHKFFGTNKIYKLHEFRTRK